MVFLVGCFTKGLWSVNDILQLEKKTIKSLSIIIYENCVLVGEVIFRVIDKCASK